MIEHLMIFLIAAGVSAFGTVVGFGGGVFMVPILTLLFGLPIQLAIGSIIVALFPSALISTFYNLRKDCIDFVVGLLLECPTVIGTIIGAWLTTYLPTRQLEILFSILVIWTGIAMFRRNNQSTQPQLSLFKRLNNIPPRLRRQTSKGVYQMSGITVTLFGLLSGIVAGLFGIGGGFIKGPLMVLGFGMPARVAAPTALFMIVITSAVGSVSHYWLGHLRWEIGLLLTSAFVTGALLGNHMTRTIAERRLVKAIGLGLIAAGIAMVIFTGSHFRS
jgi:uncharacterized membrane protein YfcA